MYFKVNGRNKNTKKKMQNSRSDQQLDLSQVVFGSTPAGYTYA